ncbi:hypothetical protein ACN47E_003450 [Coniothyrium glycines]
MESADSSHPPAIAAGHRQHFPQSQESLHSAASSTFSLPGLPSSSSTLSTSTAADTESTSPSSANAAPRQARMPEAVMTTPATPGHAPPPGRARAHAPHIDTVAANAPRAGDTAASPMSLASPMTQGFKRSADGSVKGIGLGIDTPAKPIAAHKRNKSMDTHSGTRIGELSAQLKTRLSYAMVKVQNGWEKQSLEELEEVHSQRGSPNSAPGRSDRLAFDSPSTLSRPRRPSGVSENSDHMLLSPASDPLRSHAITPPSYWRPGTKPAIHAAANLISVTGSHAGHGLAPAPDIQAGRRRRSSTSHVPPSYIGSSQKKHYSDLGSTPRTPATPRAGILRMPSQQAEKDAVDTLLFMSSPNNSQRFPPGSQAAPTPLRAEAPQRRVMFEAFPPQEKRVVYQPPLPATGHYQREPYAAHPAR